MIKKLNESSDDLQRKLKDIDTMVYAVHKLTSDEYGSLLDNVNDITTLSQDLPEHKFGTTEKHINSIYKNFNTSLRYLNSVAAETDELLNFLTAYGSGSKPSYAYESKKLSVRESKTVNELSHYNYKKWTDIFDDMINTIGVSVSWDPNKKAYYLEDLQGTLSFYGDYFKKATQVVERLYELVEDYVTQDLDEESEEYGLTEFDEFNITDPRFLDNWCTWYEDFDIDANDPDYIELGRKFIKDHKAEFEWADLMCNHADDVDLSYLKK